MSDVSNLPRRKFLYGSALVAGTATLAACSSKSSNSKKGGKKGGGGGAKPGGSSSASPKDTGASSGGGGVSQPNIGSNRNKDKYAKDQGSSTTLTSPTKFKDPDSLKAMVSSGKLPAIDKRIPAKPYVVPHKWLKAGKYGGVMNMYTFSSQGTAKADSNREFFYGHSILRYVNDGLDTVAGLAEKWSPNKDTSVWTIKFRQGLKWSDGTPWTTRDIQFWWEDIILPGHDAQSPPDETKSGKGTVAKLTFPDATTMVMTFDAPSPLAADRMAMWVNGNIGRNGPAWMFAFHYLKQFHPKYNKSVPKNWDTVGGLWERHADWMQNPACPTMNGFKTKSYSNGSGVVLERNPYYYAVMPNGDQLPYIDTINIATVQDANVGKLGLQQGKYDFCLGYFTQVLLSDVQTISASKDKAKTEIYLWDGGSGTGSIFFLNYDYPDAELRKVFRDKRFRQALSLSFNRDNANKALYFGRGLPSTGTLSTKAAEFVLTAQGKKNFAAWRDSYKGLDVAKANKLLDDLGMKKGRDGHRTLPSGKKFVLNIDYATDMSTTEAAKDDQLVSDWKAISINANRNPVTPQSFGDSWTSGKLMSHTNWEVGDGPNCLVYPQWMVPIESSRWAPLEGAFYDAIGTPTAKTELSKNPWKRNPPRLEPDKTGPIQQMWDLYNKTKVEPDETKRTQLVFEIQKVHITDGPFFMGSAANYPHVVVKKTALQNVPKREQLAQFGFVNPWIHPTPAVYDPETWFWDDPSQHAS